MTCSPTEYIGDPYYIAKSHGQLASDWCIIARFAALVHFTWRFAKLKFIKGYLYWDCMLQTSP